MYTRGRKRHPIVFAHLHYLLLILILPCWEGASLVTGEQLHLFCIRTRLNTWRLYTLYAPLEPWKTRIMMGCYFCTLGARNRFPIERTLRLFLPTPSTLTRIDYDVYKKIGSNNNNKEKNERRANSSILYANRTGVHTLNNPISRVEKI